MPALQRQGMEAVAAELERGVLELERLRLQREAERKQKEAEELAEKERISLKAQKVRVYSTLLNNCPK
jgi:hypothetical protein